MLKTVIHNWDDDRALRILRNTRAAMDPGHRLLVPDFVNGPDTGTSESHSAWWRAMDIVFCLLIQWFKSKADLEP